jgi:hypothetical protein
MKKTTQKLSTLRELEMKQAVAGSKIVVPVGATMESPAPDEPSFPKPEVG